jgi:hypothetical protein
MSSKLCEEVRTRLALGEDATGAEASHHLRSCKKCRLEASRIGRLTQALARTAVQHISPRLDRTVLALLSEHVGVPESIMRPRLAIALAVVALIAGILALVGWSGESGEGSSNPLKIVLWVWVYLALAAVVTLPMLVHHALGQRECMEGMQK